MTVIRVPDVLLRVGGRAMWRHGVWAVAGAGRHRTEVPITFSRAAVRRTRGYSGVGSKVASGVIATEYPAGLTFPDGSQAFGLRLDGARTQLVTDPENFGNWTLLGTAIRTGGQADPFGGTNAWLIEDDSAAGDEGILQDIPFIGDG